LLLELAAAVFDDEVELSVPSAVVKPDDEFAEVEVAVATVVAGDYSTT
jgi:hypothetical protein